MSGDWIAILAVVVTLLGLSVKALWTLITKLVEAVRKRVKFEDSLLHSISENGRKTGELSKRVESIEQFMNTKLERRQEPRDLVRVAKVMGRFAADAHPGAEQLIQAILERYEPKG